MESVERQAERIAELTAKIKDQEEQLAFLHRQQRDVRFLAKQLAREVQLRLNRRAKSTVQQPGLVYDSDMQIEQRLHSDNADASRLVTFIHERDRDNIRPKSRSLVTALRPLFWKTAAGTFSLCLTIARRVVRRLR